MSQNFESNSGEYLTAGNPLGAGYSIASCFSGLSASTGNATYGSASYETYSISGGGEVADAYSSNGTVNQIANDLLQLTNRNVNVNSGNYNQTVSASYQALATGTSNLSSIEAAILRSNVPIDINETEEITWNGQRGIWANKAEVINWRGLIPLNEYRINEDPNPEVITKKTEQQLVYQQEVAIRYLRPPTPPAPGEILIQQELNTVTPPAPPLIIRQQPPRPTTPQPLVVREAPPQPPAQVGR